MQLTRLMETYSNVLDWAGSSAEIDGITPDSDRVLPGYLFVALPDDGEDGHGRVHQALLKGAVGVLGEWPPDDLPENLPWGVFTYVHVLDAVKAWFWLCKNWSQLCKLGADPDHDRTAGPTAGLPGFVSR
jgi:UDP-N-acetylmuramyl pentapeptide synthase